MPRERSRGTTSDDKWHHAVFVWNRDKRHQQLFIDGRLIDTNTGPGNMGLGGAITLGRANSEGSFTGGSLDEFRIYSRCLTDKEISQLSNWRR